MRRATSSNTGAMLTLHSSALAEAGGFGPAASLDFANRAAAPDWVHLGKCGDLVYGECGPLCLSGRASNIPVVHRRRRQSQAVLPITRDVWRCSIEELYAVILNHRIRQHLVCDRLDILARLLRRYTLGQLTSKNLPWRTSATAEYPRPCRAERIAWPCGSRTVAFGETKTRAFMGSNDYRMGSGKRRDLRERRLQRRIQRRIHAMPLLVERSVAIGRHRFRLANRRAAGLRHACEFAAAYHRQ